VENIICLGTVACKVGREFNKYDKYRVFSIDDEGRKRKNFLKIKKNENPEDYESNYDPKIDEFLKPVKDTATIIVCGASLISGALLRVMEGTRKNCSKLKVVYIQPETELLSETKKLQERLVYNILQQYARSGTFSLLYLLSNTNISLLLPEVSIIEYYDKINEIIASTVHMINVFDNSKSVVDTFSPLRPSSRICTLLVFNPIEEETEKVFFSLDNPAEARYYYGIPKKNLEEEKDLYRKILSEMKKRLDIFSKVSYGIYETLYENKIGYGVIYSNRIQELSKSESSTD